MRITRHTYMRYPDQIVVKVILDTSRARNKARDIFSRIGLANDYMERRTRRFLGRIINLLG